MRVVEKLMMFGVASLSFHTWDWEGKHQVHISDDDKGTAN
jgi:hypothetical protein